jgi:hypothetical protein
LPEKHWNGLEPPPPPSSPIPPSSVPPLDPPLVDDPQLAARSTATRPALIARAGLISESAS